MNEQGLVVWHPASDAAESVAGRHLQASRLLSGLPQQVDRQLIHRTVALISRVPFGISDQELQRCLEHTLGIDRIQPLAYLLRQLGSFACTCSASHPSVFFSFCIRTDFAHTVRSLHTQRL